MTRVIRVNGRGEIITAGTPGGGGTTGRGPNEIPAHVVMAREARMIRIRRHPDHTRTSTAFLPQPGLIFPVAPPRWEFTPNAKWQEKNVVGLGDVIHSAGEGLATFQFESFFPGFYDPDLCASLPNKNFFLGESATYSQMLDGRAISDQYVFRVRTIYENQDIIRLHVGEIFSGMPAVISEFRVWEEAGRPLDRMFSITFKEWREQELVIRAGTRYRRVPKTYRPKKNEDLRDVSLRWFGTVAYWKKIASVNKIKKTSKAKIPKKKKVLKLPQIKTHGGSR